MIGCNYKILEIPNITGCSSFQINHPSFIYSFLFAIIVNWIAACCVDCISFARGGSSFSKRFASLIIFIWLSLYSPFNLLGGHNSLTKRVLISLYWIQIIISLYFKTEMLRKVLTTNDMLVKCFIKTFELMLVRYKTL